MAKKPFHGTLRKRRIYIPMSPPFGLVCLPLQAEATYLLLGYCYQVYHSGLKLDDPLTKERTHDYLLFTSPRKVSSK